AGPAGSAATGDALVVGTYAYPGRDRAAAVQPLADYLAARSGRDAVVRLWPSPSALVEALAAGDADVIVPNLHGYLQGRAQAVTLPVPDVPPAQAARYRSVIVARGAAGFEDLAAGGAATRRLCLVGKDSATGGFVPLARLRQSGLPPTAFAAVVYAGSHEAVLAALRAGEADVAALAVDVYDAAPVEGVRELWRSPPLPPGPLLCREAGTVPCAEIAGWLLDAHATHPAVMAALRAGWPEFGDAMRFVDAAPVLARLPDGAD
ncbi:MAG: PhnD/SsuA/transferrin family substrate-binding protein, partial [Planctomycetota bacterium]|nr:PhnD/SsuA/transferrin family substrate-binding protein [Planctomycetota bacterium]